MTRPLRVLITNDDGVDAPGLAVMRRIAAAISDDVWVVAPDGNQSGAGHRFTFGRELEIDKREERVFAIVGGTPADCVVVGFTHIMHQHQPDLVLSGVNNGQNLGDIIHCSGTAAGAREGALQGAIAIAMSQAVNYDERLDVVWDCAERYGADVVRGIVAEAQHLPQQPRDTYYNVNFPFGPVEAVTEVRVVPHQHFSRSPFRYYASENEGRFFIAIPDTPLPLDLEGDFHVLHHERAITVTPLTLRQTDSGVADRLRGKLRLAKAS